MKRAHLVKHVQDALGAAALKGYSANEIVGSSFSRFYTSADQQDGLPDRALQVASKEGRFQAEGWRVEKDGSKFWALVVIDAVRSERATCWDSRK